jgi:hypothetical protein
MNTKQAINKAIITELKKTEFEGIALSELIKQKTVTLEAIKEYIAENEDVEDDDRELFEQVLKNHSSKPKKEVAKKAKSDTESESEKPKKIAKKIAKKATKSDTESESEKPKKVAKVAIPEVYEPTTEQDFPEIGLTGITSEQLRDILQQAPQESEDPLEDGYRFIYYIKIGNSKYEIYDKADEEDNFDENIETTEWYASSKGTMKALRKAFNAEVPYEELEELETKHEFTDEELDAKATKLTNPLPEDQREWRYGYRFNIGQKTFFVHDFANEDDIFDPEDDIEWFVRGNGSVNTLVKYLK